LGPVALFEWSEDDRATRRMVIAQLVNTKLATRVEVARVFGLHVNTVSRIAQKVAVQGVTASVGRKRGPHGPFKVTPAIVGELRGAAEDRLTERAAQRRLEQRLNVTLSQPQVRRVMARLKQELTEQPTLELLPVADNDDGSAVAVAHELESGALEFQADSNQVEQPWVESAALALAPGQSISSRYLGLMLLYPALHVVGLLEQTRSQLRSLPARVPLSSLGPLPQVPRLERKLITDVVKSAAYNAQSWLADRLAGHYTNTNDLHDLLRSFAQLSGMLTRQSDGGLRVCLEPPDLPLHRRALAGLCADLNLGRPVSPGTDRRLRYEIAEHQSAGRLRERNGGLYEHDHHSSNNISLYPYFESNLGPGGGWYGDAWAVRNTAFLHDPSHFAGHRLSSNVMLSVDNNSLRIGASGRRVVSLTPAVGSSTGIVRAEGPTSSETLVLSGWNAGGVAIGIGGSPIQSYQSAVVDVDLPVAGRGFGTLDVSVHNLYATDVMPGSVAFAACSPAPPPGLVLSAAVVGANFIRVTIHNVSPSNLTLRGTLRAGALMEQG
jgi:hypothetical protein